MKRDAFAEALRREGLGVDSPEALIMIAIAQTMIELAIDPMNPHFIRAINMLTRAINDVAAHTVTPDKIQ